jgi:hypothetical protein
MEIDRASNLKNIFTAAIAPSIKMLAGSCSITKRLKAI